MAEYEQDLVEVGEAVGYAHRKAFGPNADRYATYEKFPPNILKLLKSTRHQHSCIGIGIAGIVIKYSPRTLKDAIWGCMLCPLKERDPLSGAIYCPVYRECIDRHNTFIANLALAANLVHIQTFTGEGIDIRILPVNLREILRKASKLPNCLSLSSGRVERIFIPESLIDARQKCDRCPLEPRRSDEKSPCLVYQARVDQTLSEANG